VNKDKRSVKDFTCILEVSQVGYENDELLPGDSGTLGTKLSSPGRYSCPAVCSISEGTDRGSVTILEKSD